MIASLLIKEDILPLNLDDDIEEALGRMSEYNVSHFPVTDNGRFVGVIAEEDIFNLDNYDIKLRNISLHFENNYVNGSQYIFDVLKMASNQKLSIIPVIDESGQYMGSITQNDIVQFFAESMAVDYPGGVVVLEVSINDYSLTEIANIVETNDAKILSSHIVSKSDSSKIEVIIKVSKIDLGAILQTFERYSYKILDSFQENVDYEELKGNYDSLINYLNI